IGLDEREFQRMVMIYDVLELATAVKPWLLRTLLAKGGDVVAYFDPDIEVFAPLDEIPARAREHSIVLTPHITDAASRETNEWAAPPPAAPSPAAPPRLARRGVARRPRAGAGGGVATPRPSGWGRGRRGGRPLAGGRRGWCGAAGAAGGEGRGGAGAGPPARG